MTSPAAAPPPTMHRPAALEFRAVRLSAVEAEVQLVWRGPGAPDRLTGWLSGPISSAATTVPSRFRVLPPRPDDPATALAEQAAQAGEPASQATVVGRVVVSDPCYWRPGAPFLYRVRLESSEEGKPVRQVDDWTGLRWLETADQKLRSGGEPWFLEGFSSAERDASSQTSSMSEAPPNLLERLAAAGCCWAPPRPTEALLREASRRGVGIVLDAAACGSDAEALRLAAEPCVALVRNASAGVAARLADVGGPLLAQSAQESSSPPLLLCDPPRGGRRAAPQPARLQLLSAAPRAVWDASVRRALQKSVEAASCAGWLGSLGDAGGRGALPDARFIHEEPPLGGS